MTEYRRSIIEGATYFFTVNCKERKENHLLTNNIDCLRDSFRKIKEKHPFEIDAIVILPEHIHCIWTLPARDSNFGVRWSLIKANFSRHIPLGEKKSTSRIKRGERGLWQRRFWEHLIRDDEDFSRHVDYIHWNPVKHGWVEQVSDWPYSSFHSYVKRGTYPKNWAGEMDEDIDFGE